MLHPFGAIVKRIAPYAGWYMREFSIHRFKKEISLAYRGEQFLVRDNGAICRLRRPNQRKRPLDEIWTLGNQCTASGYMKISELVIHKIVATAFYGEQPSSDHVVDHIDTNRRNNRMENLRWVTRLENIANNTKTFRRIKQKWGSIEGLLQDPNRLEKTDPLSNRPWMRQKVENEIVNDLPDVNSLTPLAVQRNWKTPSEFPLCPETITDESLISYLRRLQKGSVFSRNRFGESIVEMASLSEDGSCLSVISNTSNSVKGWALSKITFEDEKFVHAGQGTFFSIQGAEKRYCELIGKSWDGDDSIDNYC